MKQIIAMGGISAGSICWFQQGLTDSLPGALTPLACLGFLKGSNCPHYDGESKRRPDYTRLIGSGKMLPGLAADDGVALHFIDNRLVHVVSSRPNAGAYHVGRISKKLKEQKIFPIYLGK